MSSPGSVLVTALASRRFKAHHDIFPLRVFRRDLAKRGFDLHFCHSPNCRTLAQSKVVIVSSTESGLLFGSRERTKQYLRRLRDRGIRTIWFDSTDTGNIEHRYLIDDVDIYAKEQLWKDRSIYRTSIYQSILFKQYYRDKFAIEEANGRAGSTLEPSQIQKLAVAWNLGMSDWRLMGRQRAGRALGILLPRASYGLRLSKRPLVQRALDIAYRAPPSRHQAIVDFHRQMLRDRLTAAVAAHGYRARYEGRLDYAAFRRELTEARIITSPFGWGEICYRDFECFEAGAVLLKPDMDHLETWPDVYRPGETYVSHAWDFSDFEQRIEQVLNAPDVHQLMARRGQQVFLDALSGPRSGAVFADRFRQLLRQ